MIRVYIDSAPENIVPELALSAEQVLGDRWNGWLRPLATARQFERFLDAWRLNDPNGIWGHVESANAEVLLYCNSDAPEGEEWDHFPAAGTNDEGETVYDLTGWVWIHDAGHAW